MSDEEDVPKEGQTEEEVSRLLLPLASARACHLRARGWALARHGMARRN